VPDVHDLASAFLDARASGRAVAFRSSHSREALASVVRDLWGVESFADGHGPTVVTGLLSCGLHLSLFRREGVRRGYELILIREPFVRQAVASSAWARVVGDLWQLIDP
jgi:hypothetical protein